MDPKTVRLLDKETLVAQYSDQWRMLKKALEETETVLSALGVDLASMDNRLDESFDGEQLWNEAREEFSGVTPSSGDLQMKLGFWR